MHLEAEIVEERAANGNYIAYACGPLKKPRHTNPTIEAELQTFRKEIETNYEKSTMKHFKFPKPQVKSFTLNLQDSLQSMSQTQIQVAARNISHHRFLVKSYNASPKNSQSFLSKLKLKVREES